MELKIAIIADVHYTENEDLLSEGREGGMGDVFLRRTVHRLNQKIKPDIAVLLGDILDDGHASNAEELREEVLEILNMLESPYIILPGNHDGRTGDFYRTFPRPPEVMDIKGHRLLSFIDKEEPGYNARRLPHDLERMERASSAFDGPVITLQHTSLFPPRSIDCPYNYTNIEEILEILAGGNIALNASAHFHEGSELVKNEYGSFIVAPALCEQPFSFVELNIKNGRPFSRRHQLEVPEGDKFFDYHIHSPFAYCSENMSFDKSIRLAKLFGINGISFSEHSGHLYFKQEDYWSRRYFNLGLANAPREDNRAEAFLTEARQYSPPAKVGLEVDCGPGGRPLVYKADSKRADLMIGAVHTLPEFCNEDPDLKVASRQYIQMLERFLASGICILAHPFRVYRKYSNVDVPEDLFSPTVNLLKKHGVAAEINFHTNRPDPEFFSHCIESGVKLAFGSDAHELYEVGEFFYHLEFLKECGFGGNPEEILLPGPVEQTD